MDCINIQDVIESVENDDLIGFCIACGVKHFNIEPDARNYECENCGLNEVYGAEEILMMYDY